MANISWTMKNGMVSLSNEEELAKLEQIGQNKGLAFSFRDEETITFPPLADAAVSVKTWKDKAKKTQSSLYGMAHSTVRGGQFDVPLAAFRRVPIEEERAQLYDEDNILGETLAQSNLSDIERYRLLAGKTIKVTVVKLHSPVFEWDKDSGEWKRVEGQLNPLTCFKFEDITPKAQA